MYIPMCIADEFTIANIWNHPGYSLTDDGIKKMWCLYIMGYYSVMKRMKCQAICNKMDAIGDYAKWNKPEIVRQLSHGN